MGVNPMLAKLGLSDNARAIVFHADDIGMCQASVGAYADLLGNSPLSAASTMVPCAWFPAAAKMCREQSNHPALDMGVHLTLTSEWDTFRWKAISTADRATGLFDDEGYFHRQVDPVQKADIVAVEAELEAQIAQAAAAGIDFTHIDNHMGVLMQPAFMDLYMRLGLKYQVPAFAVRMSADQLVAGGYGHDEAEQIATYSAQTEAKGMPLFDGFGMTPLNEKQSVPERLELMKQLVGNMSAGLHYFIIHPSRDTPELRAIAPDWEARVGDLNLFLNDEWAQVIEAAGLHVIGCGRLREVMRANGENNN